MLSFHSDHLSLIVENLAWPKLCGWWREKPVAIRHCHSIKRGSPTVHDSGVEFMARARIYKPCKTSMQSGRKAQVTRGNAWVLEYPRSAVVRPDPLMGWQSSADTVRQVRVRFPDKDSAIAYAEARGIKYGSPSRSSAASSRRPMPTISPLPATGPGRTRRHRLPGRLAFVGLFAPDQAQRACSVGAAAGRRMADGSVAQLDRAADF